jgi:anaerobic magnesium-protoporphyrin IX monomethyl ester cyclase
LTVLETSVAYNKNESFIANTDKRSFENSYVRYYAPKHFQGKIQIIRPFAVLSKNTYSAPVTLPIGPAYLAAVLRKSNYDVGIIDAIGEDIYRIVPSECGRFNLQGISIAEIIRKIELKTQIVGISTMFSQDWLEHRNLIRSIKRARPDLKIVAGGEHVTALPEFVLRDCPEIDFIITGEGELAFLELVSSLASEKGIQDVKGLSFIDANGEFISTGLSQRILNVDEVPRPAWDLCNVDSYFIDNWTMGISMGRNMPILATRGCPYQCTFCSNPTMWTTRYIMRDYVQVVDEIEWLIETYKANSIDFFDLTAIIKKNWILNFCRELERRNINIVWQLPSGTRSEALDKETLAAIYNAGCRFLVYAPESGSPNTLKKIKKKIDINRLTQSMREAIKVDHTVKANLIIGFPHEKYKDVLQTIRFAIKMAIIGVDDCNISLFSPYPGSEIYNDLRAKNKIEGPCDNYFANLVIQFDFTSKESVCNYISGGQLKLIRIFGHALFYSMSYILRPSRLVRLVSNLLSNRFQASNLFEQRLSDALARFRVTHLRK